MGTGALVRRAAPAYTGYDGMTAAGDAMTISKMHAQRGFTLIELIIVIIILSVLAATALPRFANLQTQARIAKLNGAMGAMKGASALAHAACLAANPQCTATEGSGTQLMEGVNVTMVNTYPTAEASGIITAAGLDVSPNSTDGYAVSGGGPAAGNILRVMVTGNEPNNCFFTYTAPGPGQSPSFGRLTPPSPEGSTTGC
jgi:MSHA pilin protein MshA